MDQNFGIRQIREKDDNEDDDDEDSYNSKVVELLKAKVKLDNGEDGYVFTKQTEDNQKRKFQCHICNVPISGKKGLEKHASGKIHLRKSQVNFHPHENFTKIVIKESSKLSTDVGGKVIKAPGVDIPDLAPGEPVPPGFEDIVTRVPEITATLDEMKAPLIGLEYLAEITPVEDEIEPKYCCLLCNKRGDPRTVLAHLVCFNHRIKYIGRYFPKTNTALALIPKVKEFKRGTGEVLAKIVKAIENKFGRLNPVIVDGALFDEKREEIYREMRAGRHFYETAESNYELLVDLDFIKKCAPEADKLLTIDIEKDEAKKKSTALKTEMTKNKYKNFIQDNDKMNSRLYERRPSRVRILKVKREQSVETISSSSSHSYSRSRSRSKSKSFSLSRSRSRSNSFSKSRTRSRPRYRYMYRNYKMRSTSRCSPRRDRSQSHSRSRSRSRSRGSGYRKYRSSIYKAKSPGFVRSSCRTVGYDSFYNESDDYPSSERPKSTQLKVAELRDQRRKKDQYAEYVEKLEKDMAKTLKNYKKNPEKHPLYPEEWKKFWSRRYKELTAEGVDASKYDFKPEWIKFWLVRMKELHKEELEVKKKKFKAELGLIEKERSVGLDSDVIEVSPTPLEDDKSNVTVDDIKNTWKALTGNEIKSVKEKTPEKQDVDKKSLNESFKSELEEPVRVITVLRLLTALESQLGSLGPRVNNLLAQAIALEKKKQFSSDSLLDISENNVLFETVKEKLKGQLFAEIVDKHMVPAIRTAIENVAELFNSWKARKNKPEPANLVTPAAALSEPLIVPGIGAVDKVSIAQQIAAALIAQGKANVTEEELEQLINAVVGMAQATTKQAPVPSCTSGSSYATTATKSDVSSVPPSSLGNTRKESDENSKPLSFQQWAPPGESSKLLHSYEEVSFSKVKRMILSKNIGELTEDNLKALLQNFKDLTSEEQQNLIEYLKELESKDPERVEKLRQFVGFASETTGKNESKSKSESQSSSRLSPFSMREGGANPFIDDGSNKRQSKDLEDDEEDYSYEDIYKAAEKKVSGKLVAEQMIKEQEEKSKFSHNRVSPEKKSASVDSRLSEDTERVLSEAKVTIDNIMGQLPSKFNMGTNRSCILKSITTSKTSTVTTNSAAGGLKTSESLATFSSQTLYVPKPSNKIPNNLINDYSYQDDIFGYSSNEYQNYSENYHMDTNSNSPYNQPAQQPMHSSYNEQTYSNYESWNDNYSPYHPSQQTNYNCSPSLPPTNLTSNYSRSSGSYQSSSQNDCNTTLYNAYREYY